MVSADDMRAKLQSAVKKAGGPTKFARANAISPQYVADCLHGRRDIGPSMAKPLGYVPVTVYVKLEMA